MISWMHFFLEDWTFEIWASLHADEPALQSLQTSKNLPKEKKSTHTNPPFPHFSPHYPPMESTGLHNRRDPAGHSGPDSLRGRLISRCGRSGQEEVTARGMLGLTKAVINYGLLPLVMHEKPTESSKRSLNQGAYFKGNLATFYWQDAVSKWWKWSAVAAVRPRSLSSTGLLFIVSFINGVVVVKTRACDICKDIIAENVIKCMFSMHKITSLPLLNLEIHSQIVK